MVIVEVEPLSQPIYFTSQECETPPIEFHRARDHHFSAINRQNTRQRNATFPLEIDNGSVLRIH